MNNYDNIETDKLIAYPKKGNLTAMLLLCGIIALTSVLAFFSDHYITGALVGLFFCVLFWMVLTFPWKEALNSKLIIDSNGIQLNDVLIANWKSLKNIEINTYYDSDGNKCEKLIVDKYDIELNNLEIDSYDLERIIKKYRVINNSSKKDHIK